MLIIGIFIVTDKRNNGPPTPALVALVHFITVLGIGLGIGMETGYAINPARDLGPRILTAMVGYGKSGMHFVLHISTVFHPPQSLITGINTGFGAHYSALSWVCKLELCSTTPSSTPALTVSSTSRTCQMIMYCNSLVDRYPFFQGPGG